MTLPDSQSFIEGEKRGQKPNQTSSQEPSREPIRPSLRDIETRIAQALPLAHFTVLDESHLHAGHEGARGGAGHYRVKIKDPSFVSLSALKRHRLVYDALRDWIPERIHALAIKASA